jgi:hypothetical protein
LIENISFTDKSFDANNIANYHLSLQVTLKGFSFCVLDRQRSKFIAFGNYTYSRISSYAILLNEAKEILAKNEILNLNYQHIKLLFATPKFTLIPSALYDAQQMESLFKFNHSIDATEILMHNFIYGNSSYVAYTIPKQIHTWFKEKYPAIRFYHQACPLTEELLLKNKLGNTQTLAYINVYADFFDFVLLEKGALKLFNAFAFKTDTDFQYFVLNVFDQLKLSPTEVPVLISGIIKKDDSKIEFLKKYIKNLDYLNKPYHFDYSFGFEDIPGHYFTNMINLYQCG